MHLSVYEFRILFELKFHIAVSCPTWVLGTEVESSAGVASCVNTTLWTTLFHGPVQILMASPYVPMPTTQNTELSVGSSRTHEKAEDSLPRE